MAESTPSAGTQAVDAIAGGITAPPGFRTAALHCGIKASALDLALLVGDSPLAAAGIFTTNVVRAAPVLVSQAHLAAARSRVRAVVVNSGCANACTGESGMRDAREMARVTAEALGCEPEQVLVASTGVIGVALKMPELVSGIRTAASALARTTHLDAARAIMTTDREPKEAAVTVTTSRGAITIGGMAKGAGMIEPHMATLLGFLTTDVVATPALLDRALREAADASFNAITIDGDTSTNDSLFALASGVSGVPLDEDTYPAFVAGLRAVSTTLAMAIVRGGEGATKLISVQVTGATSPRDADTVARTIANSLLVKTAIHGADPNWGRILAAAGRAGVAFPPTAVTVHVGDVLLFERGLPHDEAAPDAERHLKGADVRIVVDLGSRPGAEATVWTCDLSAEYVRINGEYRT